MKLSISMTRRETMLGWSYLLVSMFILPFVLDFFPVLSDTEANIIYFFLNFLCAVLIFHRFLWVSLKAVCCTPWRCLRFAAIGVSLYFLVNLLLSRLFQWVYPAFSNVNDGSVLQLMQEHSDLMAFATVWLVPVTEELFYRGLVFQGLQAKSRVLAYGVSMVIFASIHVMSYVGTHHWLTLVLCFVQYLPAGAALAWAYEKADTIAAPILMHITINQIGIAALR